MSRVLSLIVLLAIATTAAATCVEYCAVLKEACNTPNTAAAYPYLDDAGCLSVCATFPADTTGANPVVAGNSMECRLYHATVANTSSSAALAHCVHAAASSGKSAGVSQCGTTCDAYCNVMVSAVATTRLGTAPFATLAQCLTYCNNYFQTTGGPTLPPITSGDTAECRQYHATVGYQLSSVTGQTALSTAHLSHGLPVSLDYVCSTTTAAATNYSSAVVTYCNRVIASCGLVGSVPVYGQYISSTQCLADATFFTRGAVNDQTGNTLDCRLYHAGVSGQTATHDGHCQHSGINGKDICAAGHAACDSYCTVIMGACTATPQFLSTAHCLAWCAAFPDAGISAEQPYLTSGPSLQCHIYHAGVAGYSDPVYHCPHAGPSGTTPVGGAVCGTGCENFCAGELAACTGSNAQYANTTDCLAKCAQFSVGTYNPGTTAGTASNTLACRIYHANVALAGDAAAKVTHCPHTGASPTAGCVDSSMASSTGNTMGGAAGLKASIGLVAVLAVAVAAL